MSGTVQMSDEQFEKLIGHLGDQIAANSRNLADNAREVALLRQAVTQMASEQAKTNTRILGDRDDGIIYKISDRVDELEKQQKSWDRIVLIISAMFTILLEFIMKQFGGGEPHLPAQEAAHVHAGAMVLPHIWGAFWEFWHRSTAVARGLMLRWPWPWA